MQKKKQKRIEGTAINTPNHIAILAILIEMARHLNENISKVELKPFPQALTAAWTAEPAAPGAKT